jgi:prevent-host-death family protein
MDYADKIEPVSVLKSRSAEIIRRAQSTGQPIVITQNGKAACVIQDVASFERQREMLLLLRALVQGDQDYKSGRKKSHDKAKKRFLKKLYSLEKHG